MTRFDYNDSLPQDINDHIIHALATQATSKKSISKGIKLFSYTAKNEDDTFVGAISGFTYYGCLHVSLLFVEETYRNQTYGKQLLKQAEMLAKERKCTFITINSMEWEAHEYYLNMGYEIDFIQPGYENDSKKYFLRKALTA